MVQVVWTALAVSDLQAIYEYIALNSERYGRLQVLRIRWRTRYLVAHPYLGRVVPEVNNVELRELIEGSYRIIYRISSHSRIDIVTIHHAARLVDPKLLG